MKTTLASLFALVLGMVLIAGTGLFLFTGEPERVRIVSADGRAELVGDFRRLQQPRIDVLPPEPGLSDYPTYSFSPQEVGLETPAQIRFSLEGIDHSAIREVVVYDETTRMWRQAETVIAREEGGIVVEVERLGIFALAVLPQKEAPVVTSTITDLVTEAPESTVGYLVSYGYRLEGTNHVIQFREGAQAGGCGGAIERGNGTQFMTKEVDSVVFVVQWFVSSLGGCEEGTVLEAL